MIWVYNRSRDSLTFTLDKTNHAVRHVFPSIGSGKHFGCDIAPWGAGKQISAEDYELLRHDSEFMRHVKLGRLKVSDCSWNEYFSGTQASKERRVIEKKDQVKKKKPSK